MNVNGLPQPKKKARQPPTEDNNITSTTKKANFKRNASLSSAKSLSPGHKGFLEIEKKLSDKFGLKKCGKKGNEKGLGTPSRTRGSMFVLSSMKSNLYKKREKRSRNQNNDDMINIINQNLQKTSENLNNPEQFYSSYFKNILKKNNTNNSSSEKFNLQKLKISSLKAA